MSTDNIILANFEEPHRGRRGHDFWPAPDVLAAIPSLYGSESVRAQDKVVHLHYFAGGSDWWLVEFNPEDRIAFGYVRLGGQPEGAEWGYVDLDELAQVYVAPLVIVERDLGWRPRPAGEVIPDL